jgi:hypothetical protein
MVENHGQRNCSRQPTAFAGQAACFLVAPLSQTKGWSLQGNETGMENFTMTFEKASPVGGQRNTIRANRRANHRDVVVAKK